MSAFPGDYPPVLLELTLKPSTPDGSVTVDGIRWLGVGGEPLAACNLRVQADTDGPCRIRLTNAVPTSHDVTTESLSDIDASHAGDYLAIKSVVPRLEAVPAGHPIDPGELPLGGMEHRRRYSPFVDVGGRRFLPPFATVAALYDWAGSNRVAGYVDRWPVNELLGWPLDGEALVRAVRLLRGLKPGFAGRPLTPAEWLADLEGIYLSAAKPAPEATLSAALELTAAQDSLAFTRGMLPADLPDSFAALIGANDKNPWVEVKVQAKDEKPGTFQGVFKRLEPSGSEHLIDQSCQLAVVFPGGRHEAGTQVILTADVDGYNFSMLPSARDLAPVDEGLARRTEQSAVAVVVDVPSQKEREKLHKSPVKALIVLLRTAQWPASGCRIFIRRPSPKFT